MIQSSPVIQANSLAAGSIYTEVPYGEETIKAALKKGPLAIGVDAKTWSHYQGGVVVPDSTTCGDSVDHAVVLVGFGHDSDSGKKYWKICHKIEL